MNSQRQYFELKNVNHQNQYKKNFMCGKSHSRFLGVLMNPRKSPREIANLIRTARNFPDAWAIGVPDSSIACIATLTLVTSE